MNHQISHKSFGTTSTSEQVTEYTLTNIHGLEIRVMNYGCTITSIKIPDRNGVLEDIVLGFDTLEGYLVSPHFLGCIIGRCAGRIAKGIFLLDGIMYHLPINQFPHHLHGGNNGFDKVIWKARPFENESGVGIDFHYLSVDGEEGYPGNLSVIVRYFLSNENALLLEYGGQSDKSTIINLTQHSYFNLAGRGDVLKHGLQINADRYLPLDPDKVPAGEMMPVSDTPFDFTTPQLILNSFLQKNNQTTLAKGLDHCWVLNKNEDPTSHAATLFDADSGRMMDVFTTEPGLQVYTGNYLEGIGKNGISYGPYSGIAMETQHFPNAPNQKDFPSVVLRPGETYSAKTILLFSVH
jgi:aldose 1-epimerase